MARLPTPGSDNGTWGNILNDYLSVEHNGDGTLKHASDTSAAHAASAIAFAPTTEITSGTVQAAIVEVQADLDAEAVLARNANNLTSGTVADARIASTIARDSEVAAAYQPLALVLTNTTASFLTADEAKLDRLTVTQAVDLDALEATVAAVPGTYVAVDDLGDIWTPIPSGDASGATDKANIQAVIDAADAAGGGNVHLWPGQYVINGALRLYDSVHLWGVAPQRNDLTRGTSIKTNAAGTCAGVAMIDVQDTLWAGVHSLALEPAAGNTCMGISDFADNTTQAGFFTIEGNHFEGFGGAAIALYGNVNTIRHNRADNCVSHFIHLKNSGVLGNGSDSMVAFNESGFCIGNGGGAGATGSAVLLEGGANNAIIANQLYNFRYGIRTDGASYNRIIGNRCEKHDLDGVLLDNSSIGNTVVANQIFNNGYVSSKCGINVAGSSNNQINGNFVFNNAAIAGGTNTLHGVLVGGANNNSVVGNHIYNVTGDGIKLLGASWCQVGTNRIGTVGQHGIEVAGSTNNTVSGNYVFNGSQTTDSAYSGITVHTAADTNNVIGNTVRHGAGANRFQFGVIVNSGCSNNTVMSNDLLASGRSANLADAGTSTVRRNNTGYQSENVGLATVASGSTTVVVTHGVAWTPTVRDIMVTPTNSMGNATKFFVSAVSTTSFTINVDVDPGATTATFAWAVHNIQAGGQAV